MGLRFFFRVTLHRPEALAYIPMAREPQRLPVVLTQTAVYTHVVAKTLDGIDSPLDLLKLRAPPG